MRPASPSSTRSNSLERSTLPTGCYSCWNTDPSFLAWLTRMFTMAPAYRITRFSRRTFSTVITIARSIGALTFATNLSMIQHKHHSTGGSGNSATAISSLRSGSRLTWFLRKAAASSLEHRLVRRFVRSVVAFWFAAPRTPPLWQCDFFLVNCSVLRQLLASERSGVVKTFRWASQA